eukprot:gnl/Hemi2/19959_TR6622_c0_g1_i1.p1 gnl/Hemi2/19959_TR6622_c0_g1~~gnl/Hemi2/19959_TR6622_c0_g1_i1.p1  ORF type:complete len:218 (-),score=109.11 gnl/Hemi2/19959_TR6622_c0_g1_i1:208-813(-)
MQAPTTVTTVITANPQMERSAFQVKLWSGILLILSIIGVIYNAVGSSAYDTDGIKYWGVVNDLFVIAIAGCGFYGAVNLDLCFTKLYKYGLIAYICLAIIGAIIFCAMLGTIMSDYQGSLALVYVIILISYVLIPCLCCGSCAYCAKNLEEDIEQSRGGVVAGYTQVVSQPYYPPQQQQAYFPAQGQAQPTYYPSQEAPKL